MSTSADSPSVITKIEQQKSKKFRYNIYINENYTFSVHEDILVKYRLHKDQVVEQAELEQIIQAEERNKAYVYALNMLSYRSRSAHELDTLMEQKGYEVELRIDVIERLQVQGYVDDEDFARQWVASRKRLRPRGKAVIRQELRQRGIEEEVISETIKQSITDDEEREMLARILHKKLKNSLFANEYELKKKVIPFAARKGFTLELIQRVIEELKETYIKKSKMTDL